MGRQSYKSIDKFRETLFKAYHSKRSQLVKCPKKWASTTFWISFDNRIPFCFKVCTLISTGTVPRVRQ